MDLQLKGSEVVLLNFPLLHRWRTAYHILFLVLGRRRLVEVAATAGLGAGPAHELVAALFVSVVVRLTAYCFAVSTETALAAALDGVACSCPCCDRVLTRLTVAC